MGLWVGGGGTKGGGREKERETTTTAAATTNEKRLGITLFATKNLNAVWEERGKRSRLQGGRIQTVQRGTYVL